MALVYAGSYLKSFISFISFISLTDPFVNKRKKFRVLSSLSSLQISDISVAAMFGTYLFFTKLLSLKGLQRPKALPILTYLGLVDPSIFLAN